MSLGLEINDKVRITSEGFHNFSNGDIVLFRGKSDEGNYIFIRPRDALKQRVQPRQFEKLEEDTTTAKKSNPKNFRNGDVIKVSGNKVSVHSSDSLVFVKFGENYYNLTADGQMKACRYLPPGTKEIITNLSGMGKFFLMSEEELEEQAARPSGGSTTDTNEMPGHSHTVTDFEHIMKMADSIQWDNTTEEK